MLLFKVGAGLLRGIWLSGARGGSVSLVTILATASVSRSRAAAAHLRDPDERHSAEWVISMLILRLPNCQLNCPFSVGRVTRALVYSYRYTTPAQGNPFLREEPAPAKFHPTEQRVTPDRSFYAQPQTLNFGQGQAWWSNRWSRLILNFSIVTISVKL